MQKSNNVSCIIISKHQSSFDYPGCQNKDKIFTISTITDKKLGEMDLEGLYLSDTNISSLRKENLYTQEDITYKRAPQEEYEY